jgi:hypothetical protein
MAGHAIRSREEIEYFLFRLEFFENLSLQTVYLNGFHVFFLNVPLIFKQFIYFERHNFWTDFVNRTHGSVFPFTNFPIQVWTLYTVN